MYHPGNLLDEFKRVSEKWYSDQREKYGEDHPTIPEFTSFCKGFRAAAELFDSQAQSRLDFFMDWNQMIDGKWRE